MITIKRYKKTTGSRGHKLKYPVPIVELLGSNTLSLEGALFIVSILRGIDTQDTDVKEFKWNDYYF